MTKLSPFLIKVTCSTKTLFDLSGTSKVQSSKSHQVHPYVSASHFGRQPTDIKLV